METAAQSTVDHKMQWKPWQVKHEASDSSEAKSSIGHSDTPDARSKSMPEHDQTSVFFHESSQILTALCGTLQVATLVDSNPLEYRRTVQQSVKQARRLLQLFRSFRAELKTLRYNATTDHLTGLQNRRTLEEHLSREISRSLRHQEPFAFVLFDLRKFKLANDHYGHAVGDDILRAVARACLECTRASDISCRIGGDEFVILLPDAERFGAETIAERVAQKFETYAKPLAPNAPLGIDYGIAIFPEDGKEPKELFQTADRKLYENKKAVSQLNQSPIARKHAFAQAA